MKFMISHPEPICRPILDNAANKATANAMNAGRNPPTAYQ